MEVVPAVWAEHQVAAEVAVDECFSAADPSSEYDPWLHYGRRNHDSPKSLSFSIDFGEFVAIIGPSGSGKSTLMNMLGCLDVSDEGSYLLDGHEVRKLSDNKLAVIRNEKIGFIFQNFNLLPKLSAVENVELPLIYRGLSHRERRETAQQALIKVGLGDRMHHRPSELSGGQQQRVAIARAMAGSPLFYLQMNLLGHLIRGLDKRSCR